MKPTIKNIMFSAFWGRAAMPTAPDNHDAHDYAERIREHLPNSPEAAFALLPAISCSTSRNQLAIQIARC
jgi:hypothetical protein